MRRSRSRLAILAAPLALGPTALPAHHSPNVHFDRSQVIEIEGELTEVAWRNPHVQLEIVTTNEAGVEQTWEVEYLAPSFLARQGVSPDLFQVGDTL